MATTITRHRVDQKSSYFASFILRDNTRTVVPLADIDEAYLTLYDVETFEAGASPSVGIINGRDSQNVLNANNVTIHATSGLVTFEMQPEDNPIVTERRQIERHRAVFHFVVGGTHLRAEVHEFQVRNLPTVS